MTNGLLKSGYMVTGIATSFYTAGVASGTWGLNHPLFYVALAGVTGLLAGILIEDEHE